MSEALQDQRLREVFAARHRALAEQWTEGAPLSAAGEKKITRLLARRKRFYYPLINTALKRVACILLAVLLLGSGATVGVSSLRSRESGLYLQRHESGATVYLRAERAVAFEANYPTYIPQGYALVRDQSKENRTYLLYEGAGRDFFCYAQYPQSSAVYNIGDLPCEKVAVGEHGEGFYVPNGDYACLLFTEGKFMYVINGSLPREELFKVAESLLKEEQT